jgi:hypothetical protein
MTVQQTFTNHKAGMARSFDEFRRTRRKDDRFQGYALWIMDQVWRIDSNPRLATLTLFLHYNCPELEEHAELIWNYYHNN